MSLLAYEPFLNIDTADYPTITSVSAIANQIIIAWDQPMFSPIQLLNSPQTIFDSLEFTGDFAAITASDISGTITIGGTQTLIVLGSNIVQAGWAGNLILNMGMDKLYRQSNGAPVPKGTSTSITNNVV